MGSVILVQMGNFVVGIDGLEELPDGRHHQVHPPQIGLQITSLLSSIEFQLLTEGHTLVGQVAQYIVGEYGVDMLHIQLQLGGKLQEISDQPEKVGCIYGYLLNEN